MALAGGAGGRGHRVSNYASIERTLVEEELVECFLDVLGGDPDVGASREMELNRSAYQLFDECRTGAFGEANKLVQDWRFKLDPGGGVLGGQVIGKLDPSGANVADRPVLVTDLFQSIYHALGIDASYENHSPNGRPIKLVDGGVVVRELFV